MTVGPRFLGDRPVTARAVRPIIAVMPCRVEVVVGILQCRDWCDYMSTRPLGNAGPRELCASPSGRTAATRAVANGACGYGA